MSVRPLACFGARFCALLPVIAGLAILASPVRAVTPEGLVFEAEDIATPVDAWLKDVRKADRWMLWTAEQDIEKKRSRGAVLASPAVEQDREKPDEGAPPLHCVVRLEPGVYQVHLSAPGRPLAFSQDGKTWRRYEGGELHLGTQDCRPGRFEFWIDDRFAHPAGNPGPGYFDYVRFVPVTASALAVRAVSPWPDLDGGVTREGNGWAVPAQSCEREGFEPEGPRGVRASGKGARLSWKLDRAGDFHYGIEIVDGAGIEDLRVRCAGKEVAQCIGDLNDGRRVLFVSREPVRVRVGERFEIVVEGDAGECRIERIFFSERPIEAPPLRLENFMVWSPQPGTAQVCWTSSRPVPVGRLFYRAGEGAEGCVEGGTAQGRNHRLILRDLDPAREYQARVETVDSGGAPCASGTIAFRPVPSVPAPGPGWTMEIGVSEPTGQARRGWPVVGGLPFARGKLARVEDLRLADPEGRPVALQAEPFVFWPDGSVKVAILSFAADTRLGEPVRYRLEAQAGSPGAGLNLGPVVTLAEEESGWKLGGRALHFDLGRKVPALFDRVGFDWNGDGKVSRSEIVTGAPMLANLRLRTGEGIDLTCGAAEEVVCERNGPVRALLRWSGKLMDAAGAASDWCYLIRAGLVAGRPEMELDVAVWPDAREPVWREVESLALRVPLQANGPVRGSLDGRPLPDVLAPDGLAVLQETEERSSYDGRPGAHAAPLGVATVSGGNARITAVLRDFWQTYPNGLAVKPDGLHLGLLPALPRDIYKDEKPLEQLRLFGWCRDGRYVFKRGQVLRKRVTVRFANGEDGTEPAVFAGWANAPLLLDAPVDHLCSSGLFFRALYPPTPGIWDAYETYFAKGYEDLAADRAKWRTWGWMHHGDWFGERLLNFGNNEYDLAWAMALQWGRTGDRRYFERGAQMASHHSGVDTLRGEFTAGFNGLVYEHSFNHVGIELAPDDPRREDPLMRKYLAEFGSMLGGAIDRQGHVFQGGNWIYAALTGDEWLRETAERVCLNQAEKLTPAFDFSIERAGGWPLINMVTAYHFTGNPYYLNAARLMVERALQRQDPVSGGWLHWHAGSESGGETGLGGKAFAAGILGHGLLRYLDVESLPRPEVERMLVRGADFLRDCCWVPGEGFRYISHLAYHRDRARQGSVGLLNAEMAAFAYEKRGDSKYLDFFREITEGRLEGTPGGNGKGFSMALRQTVYGLERIRPFGVTEAPASGARKAAK